jgi:aspartyl/asparaginyl beta-hydroxylase (cupin superfamily)
LIVDRARQLFRATILAVLYSPLLIFNALVWVVVPDRRRFMEPEEYPELAVIERAFPEIRAELMTLLEERDAIPSFAEVEEGQERLAGDGRWKTVIFRFCGVDVPENWKRCPDTAAAIQQVPGITIAMFSIFEPGKRLPVHMGAMKGVLRYHLPLLVADSSKCGVRVGGETRQFEEGKPLLFDDTYFHTAWNESAVDRVVLFIDVERRLPYRWLTRLNHWMMRVLAETERVKKAAALSPLGEDRRADR